jgi:amino acid transporter
MAEGNGTTIARKFGTFGGVFTPSVLTILSAILFMRTAFVVGEAGVLGTLAILVVANIISLLSAISVCAVSTNMQVRGGGAYFLISRVLGPEFGGAIGIVFFFALSLNVAFNILGFTEALIGTIPALDAWFLPISLIAAAVLLGIAFIGAEWSIKTQFAIMALLVVSIAALWGGALLLFDPVQFNANMGAGYSALDATGGGLARYSFWIVFAIFFPSVTGFLAGINMSGDLKDPAKSIPVGTFLAVGVGAAIYLVTMLLVAGAFPRAELISRPFESLKDSALFNMGFLVAAGVFAATLSTALGSYLGAPRVLQAVARDRLLPILAPFAKGSLHGDEPRRALLLTGVLALSILVWAALSGGDNAFNIVASVISMVFLATYGMINLAAFIEGFGGNPSFRPRFRFFHWLPALLGFLGCAGVALIINAPAAIAAAVAIGLLYWHLARQKLKVSFGDARRGYIYQQVRNSLLKLREMDEDGKNWRPTILAFSGNPAKREKLVAFAIWLQAGRGIVLMVNILSQGDRDARKVQWLAAQQLKAYCRTQGLPVFPIAASADSVNTGVELVLQTACVGPMRPSVALFGWNSGKSTVESYLGFLESAIANSMSVAIVSGDELPISPGRSRIDVWWRGRKNGALMLLMAHLLSCNWEWSHARLRLLHVVDDPVERESALAALDKLAHDARIPAETDVIVSGESFVDVLHEHSADADCVFLGFELPEEGERMAWHARHEHILENMPTIVIVNSVLTDDVLV